MSEFHLVVSNPPHGEEVDYARCVESFGLTAGEIRARANFGAPEIWFAESGAEEAGAKVRLLNGAGLRVAAFPGSNLAGLPSQRAVRTFAFRTGYVEWTLDDEVLALSFSTPIFLVSCRPPPPEAPRPKHTAFGRGLRKAKRRMGLMHLAGPVLGTMAASYLNSLDPIRQGPKTMASVLPSFLDFWFEQDGRAQRISLVEGIIDFSGLGDQKRATMRENLVVLLEMLQRQFQTLQLDCRLENINYPAKPAGGMDFNKLMAALFPDKPSVYPFELASRLTYLTRGPGPVAAAAPAPLPAPPPVKPARDPFGF